ncbi:hypothetical protein [Streptomyces sp. JV178]|uniref:hypothetical protein n=1 Tax=Streptomyces sp. JV178 TaxID=858632 RepID=UPI00117E9418|nr:hypothetical protein [Streptomyces sp. JV178]
MGRDGLPRLRLVVVADDDAGPRLCRECGGPLMPSVKASAVFCSSVCRSRHWRRMRRAQARTEAVQAGVTSNCPECDASWTVGIEHPASATLLSRLPQTGLAQTARGGRRVVSPRIRRLAKCFTAAAVRPGGFLVPVGWCEATACRGELTA